MAAARPAGNNANGGVGKDNNNTDKTVAKTAGFVVFSGIAMSILKALTPHNNNTTTTTNSPLQSTPTTQESTKPISLQEPIIKKPKPVVVASDVLTPSTSNSSRTIQIVKGDTLWGLSRKYGVSIGAIKEANGLTGDTIYAGKKLVIPGQ